MYDGAIKTRLDTYSSRKLLVIVSLAVCALLGWAGYAFSQPRMSQVSSVESDRRSVLFAVDLVPENRVLRVEAAANGTAVLAFDVQAVSKTNETSLLSRSDHEYFFECAEVCDYEEVLYLPFLEHARYLVSIDLVQPLQTEFRLSFISAEFTHCQLVFNYVFFAVAVLSLVVYVHALMQVPYTAWKFENKALLFLGVSLVVFNDPWAYWSVYSPSLLTYSISALAASQFIAALVIYWMIVFQNHTDMPGTPLLYATEAGLVSLAYILAATLGLGTAKTLSEDPTYRYSDSLLTDILVVAVMLLGSVCLLLLALLISGLFTCRQVVFRKRFVSVANMLAIVLAYGSMVAYFAAEDAGGVVLSVQGWLTIYVVLLTFLFTPRIEFDHEPYTVVHELARPDDVFDWKE